MSSNPIPTSSPSLDHLIPAVKQRYVELSSNLHGLEQELSGLSKAAQDLAEDSFYLSTTLCGYSRVTRDLKSSLEVIPLYPERNALKIATTRFSFLSELLEEKTKNIKALMTSLDASVKNPSKILPVHTYKSRLEYLTGFINLSVKEAVHVCQLNKQGIARSTESLMKNLIREQVLYKEDALKTYVFLKTFKELGERKPDTSIPIRVRSRSQQVLDRVSDVSVAKTSKRVSERTQATRSSKRAKHLA